MPNTSPPPSSASSQQGNAPTQVVSRVLIDEDLNLWLLARYHEQHTVVLVYAGHHCKVYDLDDANAQLLVVDPDKESAKSLKKIANAGLLRRIELAPNVLQQTNNANLAWTLLPATALNVTAFMKDRATKFGQGRGKPISSNTERIVWNEAGGRCMYRGCSKDLGRTSLTTKAARIAYLAHIVASDPDGPRGDLSTSHALSDDPENIMLMCDGHHRLIDRIDEDGHPTELLLDMRRERVSRVRSMLDGLSFPRAQAITIFGDIANVRTATTERDITNAMLDRQLAPLPGIYQAIRRTQRDDRQQTDFWNHFLHEHGLEFQDLINRFGSQPLVASGIPAEELAIFPLHLVPALVLSGRIIGEARPVQVFQYDRHRQTWRWDQATAPQPANSFQFNASSSVSASEVLLTLELTASIDERALPVPIVSLINERSIPWVRVTATQPNNACIRHPDDLEQFTNVAREAIQFIHDEIRPSRVHLIGVSPASTLFRFGQILQAGHHPSYWVYDRPDQTHPFKPGLSIEGQQVVAVSSSENESRNIIQLR